MQADYHSFKCTDKLDISLCEVYCVDLYLKFIFGKGYITGFVYLSQILTPPPLSPSLFPSVFIINVSLMDVLLNLLRYTSHRVKMTHLVRGKH